MQKDRKTHSWGSNPAFLSRSLRNSSEFSKGVKKWRWGAPKEKGAIREGDFPAGCFERGRIEVNDVRLQLGHDDLDIQIVKMIQESFAFTGGGSFQPIGIRRVKADGSETLENVLVFGAKRLQAQKDAGLKYIDCVYLTGSDTDVELIQVAENLLRKDYTVLENAEQTVRFYDLAGKKLAISGQLDQKGKRLGRRPGGMAQAARWLEALGGTDEARRSRMRRAKLIAGIGETAKQIARKTGLDNNQRALLLIAEALSPTAQAKRAQDIADGISAHSDISRQTTVVMRSESTETMGAPRKSGDASKIASVEAPGDNTSEDQETNEPDTNEKGEDTSELQLEAFWEAHGKRLWSYTPKALRDRFIEKLRRAKCRAPRDLDDFITKVFFGRERVHCETLEAFARSKGMAWKAMASRLMQLGYRRKRNGRTNGPHFYLNIDRDYKNQLPFFSDADFSRPLAAKQADDGEYVDKMELPLDAAYPLTDSNEARKRIVDSINDI